MSSFIQNWNADQARDFRLSETRRVERIRPLLNIAVEGVIKPVVSLSKHIVTEERILGKWHDRVTDEMNANMPVAFKNRALNEQDVLAIGYFKAGTNWTMQTCLQIAHRGNCEFDHIQDVISWPDAAHPQKWVGLDCPDSYRSATGQRVIKSHCLANQIDSKYSAKIIAVTRDPKDALVSSFHFFHSLVFGKLMCSPEMWLSRFMSDKALFEGWHKYTAGWYTLRDNENILFLTYEQMIKDNDSTVLKIADHMGVTLSNEELECVKHKSSFEYMKSINHKFYPASSSAFSLPNGEMIRSGKTGDGNSLFSEKQLRKLDQYFIQQLEKMGSNFPYKALYAKW